VLFCVDNIICSINLKNNRMKQLSIIPILILLMSVFQTGYIQAQDDIYSFMKEHLTADEKDQIDRAKSYIDKGDRLSSQIKKEESHIKKHKGKKKYEKKSVEAKTLRIKQGLYYEKGLSAIYDVYGEKVAASVFLYDDDEARVNNMQQDASDDLNSGKKKLKPYKKVTTKDLKKKIKYAKLKSDLSTAFNLQMVSINKLIEAYAVYLEQETKRQLEEEEKRVWQNALSENSILAFQNYLSEYSNGKYASEARSQISDLEEAARKAAADEAKLRSLANLKFHVQIAAAKKPLSKWTIKRFYKGKKQVTTKHYDVWYKYSIGEFNSYDEAKAFLKTIRVRGAFVVAYQNDKKIDIKDAIK